MHRLLGIAVVVVLVISLSCVALAQEPAKCDFDTELGKIYNDAEAKLVNLAVQMVHVTDQFRKILDKLPDKNSNKPIIEQLDKEGSATFQKLRDRQMVLMNVSLAESKRMRDMQFFRKFVILAEKDVRWPEIPTMDHPDLVPYAVLASAREHLGEKVEISEAKYDQCTLEASIQVMEQEVIDKFNAMDTTPIFEMQTLKARLAKKYKTKTLDFQKMSETDQKAMGETLDRVEPISRQITLAKDYEILKALAKASQLIYDMDKEDILTYGPVPDKIGTTLFTKANAGEYGEIIQSAHTVMRVMDTRIPCDFFLRFDRIDDAGNTKENGDAEKK